MRVALLVVTTVVSARVAIQSGINEQGAMPRAHLSSNQVTVRLSRSQQPDNDPLELQNETGQLSHDGELQVTDERQRRFFSSLIKKFLPTIKKFVPKILKHAPKIMGVVKERFEIIATSPVYHRPETQLYIDLIGSETGQPSSQLENLLTESFTNCH